MDIEIDSISYLLYWMLQWIVYTYPFGWMSFCPGELLGHMAVQLWVYREPSIWFSLEFEPGNASTGSIWVFRYKCQCPTYCTIAPALYLFLVILLFWLQLIYVFFFLFICMKDTNYFQMLILSPYVYIYACVRKAIFKKNLFLKLYTQKRN